jgi:hypothetical protein
VRRSFSTEAKSKRNGSEFFSLGSEIEGLFCLLCFKAKQQISKAKQKRKQYETKPKKRNETKRSKRKRSETKRKHSETKLKKQNITGTNKKKLNRVFYVLEPTVDHSCYKFINSGRVVIMLCPCCIFLLHVHAACRTSINVHAACL